MIADIMTVGWKELRELVVQADPRGRSRLSLLVLVFIFGILLPLQNGREWINSPVSGVIWAWMPFLWVSGIVADSFAGERERHTLESLLATRLSDRAILIGKLLAALLYGCVLTWLILVVGLITINVRYAGSGLLLFPPPLAGAALIFSILISSLAAALGVLVSLRAGSVRQAQQLMSIGMLVLFLPFIFLQFVSPAIRLSLVDLLSSASPVQIALWAAAGLLALDFILIAVAMRMFKRSKLILD